MSTGRFVWHDLMTTQHEEGKAFYRALFGWDVRDHGPQYAMVHVDGHAIGGMVKMEPHDGVPNHWITYISTDDIHATVATIEAEGGKIFLRHKAPGVGEFAVAADRQGAMFSPIQLENEAPRPENVMKGANYLSWSELHTTDPLDALAFYEKVFGWKSQPWQGEYVMVGDEHNAGITRGNPHAPPHWLVYANTDHTDTTVAKVKELGGQLLFGPQDIPGVGRFAVFMDPTGAAFAVMQSERR